MHVVRDALAAATLPQGGVATIGNFDGVHRGHRRILETVVARAEESGRPAIAITFEPHPLAILRPDKAPPRLQTLRQKEESVAATGIAFLLILAFTRDFSLTEPEDFVSGFLAERLRVSELVLGAHFAFGRGKRGSLELLERLGPACGFTASGVEEVFFEGEPVSSTRIRAAIRGGELPRANAMLGRQYEIGGIVTRGERMGEKLGFPTLNLSPENELFPAEGVYVTEVEIAESRRRYGSVTNVGRRPTLFDDTAVTIETHVLDFSENVYGERVRLFFRERLRDEKKFASAEELASQIRRDADAARGYFAAPA